MKTTIFVAMAVALTLSTNNASAQIKQRERNQHTRIVQGIKSGELTKAETANLVKKEKDVRQDVKEARADGVVTPVERKDIRKDQRQASRAIYRKKHNDRVRN